MIKKIEWLGIIATVLAVTGVMMNNNKLIGCFYVWTASNVLCSIIHVRAGLWSMVIRDVIFIVLAIDGLIRWSGC